MKSTAVVVVSLAAVLLALPIARGAEEPAAPLRAVCKGIGEYNTKEKNPEIFAMQPADQKALLESIKACRAAAKALEAAGTGKNEEIEVGTKVDDGYSRGEGDAKKWFGSLRHLNETTGLVVGQVIDAMSGAHFRHAGIVGDKLSNSPEYAEQCFQVFDDAQAELKAVSGPDYPDFARYSFGFGRLHASPKFFKVQVEDLKEVCKRMQKDGVAQKKADFAELAKPPPAPKKEEIQTFPEDKKMLEVENCVNSDGRRDNPAKIALCIKLLDEWAATAPAGAELSLDLGKDLPGAHQTRRQQGKGATSSIPITLVPAAEVRTFVKAHLADVKAKSIGPRFQNWFKIATNLWKAYKTANSDAIGKEVSGARMYLRDDVKECNKAAVAAASEGVPLDTKFTLETYDNEKVEMALKETKEKVCGLLAKEAKRVLDASAKAYAASMAPYRAALKGDKLAMFEKYGPSSSLYGAGCRLLDSPSDYANAPVWYDVLLDDRDWLVPRWTVRGYKFKGMASAGTYEKSGVGVDAPASACP